MQRRLLITIQSVDVGSCLDEGAHHCGRALEVDSKVQGGQLGGNSSEQQQIRLRIIGKVRFEFELY